MSQGDSFILRHAHIQPGGTLPRDDRGSVVPIIQAWPDEGGLGLHIWWAEYQHE